MAMEIEAKYRLADPESLRAVLVSVGAEHLGTVLETNRFFDWPAGHLREGDRGLRVRIAEPTTAPPECRPAGAPVITVTYKGPRQAGPLKVREEHEFTADCADAVAAVLDGVGMQTRMVFQKRRDSWSLGGCTLALDEVPGLGHFLEIEGPDGAAIAEAAETIGMADAPVETGTYTSLLRKYARAHDLGDGPIMF